MVMVTVTIIILMVTVIMVMVMVIILMCACVGGPNKGDDFQCEDVGVEKCAFGVSAQGERCVLETNILKDGSIQLECQVCTYLM